MADDKKDIGHCANETDPITLEPLGENIVIFFERGRKNVAECVDRASWREIINNILRKNKRYRLKITNSKNRLVVLSPNGGFFIRAPLTMLLRYNTFVLNPIGVHHISSIGGVGRIHEERQLYTAIPVPRRVFNSPEDFEGVAVFSFIRADIQNIYITQAEPNEPEAINEIRIPFPHNINGFGIEIYTDDERTSYDAFIENTLPHNITYFTNTRVIFELPPEYTDQLERKELDLEPDTQPTIDEMIDEGDGDYLALLLRSRREIDLNPEDMLLIMNYFGRGLIHLFQRGDLTGMNEQETADFIRIGNITIGDMNFVTEDETIEAERLAIVNRLNQNIPPPPPLVRNLLEEFEAQGGGAGGAHPDIDIDQLPDVHP